MTFFNHMNRSELLKAQNAVTEVIEEYGRATKSNGAFNSAHEGFAVLLEEVDELKAEVWKNRKTRDLVLMKKEAVQVAAMAIRFIADVCGEVQS